MPFSQRWTLLDNDSALLASLSKLEVLQRDDGPNVALLPMLADLAGDDLGLLLADQDCVVTSAFLDLVSEAWMERLALALAAHKLPFLASLTYNGYVSCFPAHETDAMVLAGFNAHQRTNKGFGPALGPDAAKVSVEVLRRAGFEVRQGPSNWASLPEEQGFQSALVSGWAEAAIAMNVDGDAVTLWLQDRLNFIRQGRSRIEVGHTDLIAIPA